MVNFELRLMIAGLMLIGVSAVPALADEAKPTTRTTEIHTFIHDGPSVKGATWNDGQEMKVDCPGKLTIIEASAGVSPDRKQKAKMVFCAKSGDKADAASGLEKALARVEGDNEMNPALRADLSAKLRARIAQLRAAN